MNRSFKYRIKTFEEFQTEFGEDWRSVRASFAHDMDYLLGTDIDYKYYNHVLDDGGYLIPNIRFTIPSLRCGSLHTWELSNEMLIRINLIPLYKPRKFIYE